MKKITTLFSVLLCAVAMQAQTVDLKMQYKPNTTYTSSTVQANKIEVSYGDEPMVQEANNNLTNTIKTGALKDGEIPFTMELTAEAGSGGAEQINGTKLTGKVTKEGRPVLEKLESETMLPDMKDMLKGMMQEGLSKGFLPAKKLKVGESFVQETPMAMPMGPVTLNMKDVGTYKLERVEGRKAYFTHNHIVTLDMDVEGQNMKGSGTGSGTMVYDMDSNFPVQTDTNMKMEMAFEAQGMNVNLKTDGTSKVTTVIAPTK